MRVVGGSARGVPLRTPKGPGVRPTMDRVRSALFNILTPLGLEDAAVADFFAGTGSLGIEALSRGAAHADFVEADAQQCADIRASLQATKLIDRATVLHSTVEKALERMNNKYDFILMDPPYRDPFPAHVLLKLQERRLLETNAVVVVGHASRNAPPAGVDKLALWQDRRYGDSSLAMFTLEPVTEKSGESAS
jgi:16S rRNA (guanine966-N2)-methyltransferase